MRKFDLSTLAGKTISSVYLETAPSTVRGNWTAYYGNLVLVSRRNAWGNLTAKTITKCGAENLSITALVNNQLSATGLRRSLS